ncbi:hypothetical protein QBC34DRAFT_418923 [Podospora aff. communis PSN243]|uniref:Uncharacterized protein n=1 Tax=Podospora aff. communis PSN243 TaxID=3040156 RepID=A0AAV9G4E5_9PEZI|nr:hypothetical protein QBC34DRAFT_418923 [Podospora aff. communis PSN243]
MASINLPNIPPPQALRTLRDIQAEWSFAVWEISSYYPGGRSFEVNYTSLQTVLANQDFKLQIIFAPPDVFGSTAAEEAAVFELYQLLLVPDEFTVERKQSVSHSFGIKTSLTGTCSWFHFLCKSITINTDPKGRLQIGQNKTYGENPNPAEDYAYMKSGFVINTSIRSDSNGNSHDSTTLNCFGASPNVRARLDKFTESSDKELPLSQPYLFFAPILSGLHADLDEMTWNLNSVFAEYEAKLLAGAYDTTKLSTEDSNIFASLHYLSKYCLLLLETAASLKLVTENVTTRLTSTASLTTVSLPERVQHTSSLVTSTTLHLTTLHARIKNAIALAFNLNAEKDTEIMMGDSRAMTAIALLTAVLLPATATASILGSNMFESNDEEGPWKVKVNAAFRVWCVVVAAFTGWLAFWLLVVLGSKLWRGKGGGQRGRKVDRRDVWDGREEGL